MFIPEELLSQEIWNPWKYSDKGKVAYQVNGRLAASTRPSEWTSYENAVAAATAGNYTGIGFRTPPGYLGFDLDSCLDASGNYLPWPDAPLQPGDIVSQLDSFSYVTCSGNGVRVLIKYDGPPPGKKQFEFAAIEGYKKRPAVEIYDATGRFFTFTGDQARDLPGSPQTINRRAEAFRDLYGILDPTDGAILLQTAGTVALEPETIDEFAADVVAALTGERHHVLLAVAGIAKKSGWTDACVQSVLYAVALGFRNTPDFGDVDARVRVAYNSLKEGKRLAGWSHLAKHVKPEVIHKWRNLPGFRTWKTPVIETSVRVPMGFSLRQDGVYWQPPTPDPSERNPSPKTPEPQWICGPLQVLGKSRMSDGDDWGLLLNWTDPDVKHHTWCMSTSMMNGDGAAIREQLLKGGLFVSPNHTRREKMLEYIMRSETTKTLRSVSRTGWYDACYVLPDEVIGEPSEDIVFQSPLSHHYYKSSGTHADWKWYVADKCSGNSRLLLSVSVGFAAILAGLIGVESGGFHFCGPSSTGKTTALYVAASLFGPPEEYKRSWRATSNGLEAVAALHNDSLLILDEIGEAKSTEIGDSVYMLANGRGKSRMTRSATLRQSLEWRLLFLSSGEKSLHDHMRSANAKTRAGQDIRCLDIPAVAGPLGLFEDIHNVSSAGEFSKSLRRDCAQYYGTASREFIEALQNQITEHGLTTIKDKAHKYIDKFTAEMKTYTVTGEVFRSCQRFALVALAGEMATSLQITGWLPEAASEAARTCFKEWVNNRGGTQSADVNYGTLQVKLYLEQYGTSRFEDISTMGDTPVVHNRAGFRKKSQTGEWIYYVLPEVFKTICDGYDHRTVAKALASAGHLERDSAGKRQISVKLPGMGQRRVYSVLSTIFED